MRHRSHLKGLALAIGLFALIPAALAAETLQIDPVHSTAHFKVKHLSASYFIGRFDDISGSLTFDAADPSKSSIEIEIKADSVNSGNERLDGHIESPDFLSAKQFPVMSFKSKSVEKGSGNMYEVTGTLTIRGISKDVTIEAEHVGSSNMAQFGPRTGFFTTFTVNRRDFQVNYGADEAVGDELTLMISLEATKGD